MRCHLQSSECSGRLEWHHVVKQQRLKREFKYGAIFDFHDKQRRYIPASRMWSPNPDVSLDDILGDTRNRIWVCSFHHERISNGRVKVELPPSVWAFAAEFGLTGMLENDLRRAA